MKPAIFAIVFACAGAAFARDEYAPPAVIPPPNAAAVSNTMPQPKQQYDYTPRIGQKQPLPEIVPDKDKIVQQFRDLYAKQNKPRLLLYVNRELIGREHKEHAAHEQRNDRRDDHFNQQPQRSPTDNQSPAEVRQDKAREQINKRIMSREIEDSFGFPFRDGGAVFVDQKIAGLMNSTILHNEAQPGSKGAADADAIKKNADIVVELLLDERTFPAHDIGGDHDVVLPVMTATAIRLKDSQIVAEVTSMGLFGLDSRDRNATAIMAQMTPSEIAQEMAFALMQDLGHGWSAAAAK